MTMTLPPSITHPAEALVLARIAPAVRERAAAVRLMVFDVDGVLTDGGLYYGETGEVQKRFHALDGHGLRLLMEGGLKVALMTGRYHGQPMRKHLPRAAPPSWEFPRSCRACATKAPRWPNLRSAARSN